ncbi:MAG: hypothetical protein RJA76_458 [Bacteroidota bacterium]|jgi:uncharacterized membrane protein
MKTSWVLLINTLFRSVVALIYIALGYYVAFMSSYELGYIGEETPIRFLLGILFILYGIFRIWRALVYYKNNKNNGIEYGSYEDED